VDELHTEMESLKRAIEVLQNKIDQIVEEAHATVYEKVRQAIRDETQFKWIQQVLAEMDPEGKGKRVTLIWTILPCTLPNTTYGAPTNPTTRGRRVRTTLLRERS
jgi:hypothetical protein